MCFHCETKKGGKFENRMTIGRCFLCLFGLLFVVLIGIAAGLLAFYLPDYVAELEMTKYRRVSERAGEATTAYVNYTKCSNAADLKDSFKNSYVWQCTDLSCIPDYLRCSGYYDCDDKSDETDCAKYCTESVKSGLSFSCTEDRNMTLNATYGPEDPDCFLMSMKCDGSDECPQDGDSSDESQCEADLRLVAGDEVVMCSGDNTVVCYEFGVPYCTPDSFLCDGFEYCINGEDETGCKDK